MSNVTEISPSNQKWLKWRAVSIEYVAVIISVLAALIAVIWGGLAMLVIGYQSGTINAQNERIEDLSGDIDVYRIRAAKMDAWLKAHGVPTEEIYNEHSTTAR